MIHQDVSASPLQNWTLHTNRTWKFEIEGHAALPPGCYSSVAPADGKTGTHDVIFQHVMYRR